MKRVLFGVFNVPLVALSNFWYNKGVFKREGVRDCSILGVCGYLLFLLLGVCLVLNLATYNAIRLYRVITVDIGDFKGLGYLSWQVSRHWLNKAIFVVLLRLIWRCLFHIYPHWHIFLFLQKLGTQRRLNNRIVLVKLGDLVLRLELLMVP